MADTMCRRWLVSSPCLLPLLPIHSLVHFLLKKQREWYTGVELRCNAEPFAGTPNPQRCRESFTDDRKRTHIAQPSGQPGPPSDVPASSLCCSRWPFRQLGGGTVDPESSLCSFLFSTFHPTSAFLPTFQPLTLFFSHCTASFAFLPGAIQQKETTLTFMPLGWIPSLTPILVHLFSRSL